MTSTLAASSSATTGAAVQLGVVGPANEYISSDPDTTLFRFDGALRHSNWAEAEALAQQPAQLGMGKKSTFKVERVGDYLGPITLAYQLPAVVAETGLTPAATDVFHYSNEIAFASIQKSVVRIGTNTFWEVGGEWYHLREVLTKHSNKRGREYLGYYDTPGELMAACRHTQDIYAPLDLWFTEQKSHAFPIMPLTGQSFWIDIVFRTLAELSVETGAFIGETTFSKASVGTAPDFQNLELVCSYFQLEKFERDTMAEGAWEWLVFVPRLAATHTHASSETSAKISIQTQNSVGAIYWVCQRDAVILSGTANQGNDWFNYSGVSVSNALYPGASTFSTKPYDPFTNAAIIFNTTPRSLQFNASWWRTMSFRQYHTSIPDDFIYGKIFSENIEMHGSAQGHANIGILDSCTLNITFPSGATAWTGEVRVYTYEYNYFQTAFGVAIKNFE